MQDDPDYKGIGVKLLSSLKRVGIGFGLGSLIAIPVGMLMGSSKIIMNIINPMVQILRPVSPLAWFPLGLAIFQDSPQASIFMIFICSLWPTLINTAFGVSHIPQDHKNVGKAFGFSNMEKHYKDHGAIYAAAYFNGITVIHWRGLDGDCSR